MRALIWGWLAIWTGLIIVLTVAKLDTAAVALWVVTAIILVILFAWFPGYNATWMRNHPQAIAITVGGWLWLILPFIAIWTIGYLEPFRWPAGQIVFGGVNVIIWFVLVVWSYAGGQSPQAIPSYKGPRAKSLSYPIERKFRVMGVDRATKMDTTWFCIADNEANAKVKAELEGIVVTSVTPEM
ncbi:MAG: hypothetical protein ABSB42_04415 [Tepidisphaeraceae bacterium]|jgi:hypothetical protein